MKGIFQPHKKGVSEIISYSLLIVIAVIVSVLVYSFLKLYIPKNQPECLDDVSLMIQDYTCTPSPTNTLSVTLLNNGRFNVDAAYIRIGKPGRTTKTWINKDEGFTFAPPGLIPGKPEIRTFNSLSIPLVTGDILEVQPSIIDKKTGKFAACENIVQQTITCN